MGKGRSAAELQAEEERRKRVAEQKPTTNGSAPVVEATAPSAIAVPVAAAEAEAITNGREVTSDSEDEGDDIWAAAREVPGSPIKDLAAKLEGSTL